MTGLEDAIRASLAAHAQNVTPPAAERSAARAVAVVRRRRATLALSVVILVTVGGGTVPFLAASRTSGNSDRLTLATAPGQLGPSPSPAPPEAPPTATPPSVIPRASLTPPKNLLTWQRRGQQPTEQAAQAATAAYAAAAGTTADRVGLEVLYDGRDAQGREIVFGQAWVQGQPAHTVGWSPGPTGEGEPFIGPVLKPDTVVLAFLASGAAPKGRDLLILLPRPGTAVTSYSPAAGAPFVTVASGRSSVEDAGVVARDPRADADAVRVTAADGTVLSERPVQALLCGETECG